MNINIFIVEKIKKSIELKRREGQYDFYKV